jgi:AbrB family looped-hinge helix DNA binding protein
MRVLGGGTPAKLAPVLRRGEGFALFPLSPLPWYYEVMAIAQSKLTAQGQISVPVEVRRRLGLSPGSVLEWKEQGDDIVVRRAGRYTSEDLHRALFPNPPKPLTLGEMKEGIEKYVKSRHARR